MSRLLMQGQHGLAMSTRVCGFFVVLLTSGTINVWAQLLPNSDNYTLNRISIGTNTFTDKLNIVGTSEWQISLKDNNSGGVIWKLGASGTGWAAGTGKFVLSNSDASSNASMVITNSRKVGFGVTEPKSKIHVFDGGRHYYIDRDLGINTEDGQGVNYI